MYYYVYVIQARQLLPRLGQSLRPFLDKISQGADFRALKAPKKSAPKHDSSGAVILGLILLLENIPQVGQLGDRVAVGVIDGVLVISVHLLGAVG